MEYHFEYFIPRLSAKVPVRADILANLNVNVEIFYKTLVKNLLHFHGYYLIILGLKTGSFHHWQSHAGN